MNEYDQEGRTIRIRGKNQGKESATMDRDCCQTPSPNLILLAHDSVDELILVENAIAILVGPVHHLLKFVVSHVLTQLLANALQVLERDRASLVVVEELENFEQILACVFALLARRHHREELIE